MAWLLYTTYYQMWFFKKVSILTEAILILLSFGFANILVFIVAKRSVNYFWDYFILFYFLFATYFSQHNIYIIYIYTYFTYPIKWIFQNLKTIVEDWNKSLVPPLYVMFSHVCMSADLYITKLLALAFISEFAWARLVISQIILTSIWQICKSKIRDILTEVLWPPKRKVW
jgi:hypothetical protein